MGWPKIEKVVVLKCLLLFYTTMSHFSIGLWGVTKSGLYTTTSDDQVRGWTEKFQSTFQSQTCTKKGNLVVFYQSDPLQFSESRWNHDIWEVCSANWWDAPKTAAPAAGIGQQKGPKYSPRQHLTTCGTANASKVEWRFASSAIFTWSHPPTITCSTTLTTFCRENASTASRMQKMLFKSSLNPEIWIFKLKE